MADNQLLFTAADSAILIFTIIYRSLSVDSGRISSFEKKISRITAYFFDITQLSGYSLLSHNRITALHFIDRKDELLPIQASPHTLLIAFRDWKQWPYLIGVNVSASYYCCLTIFLPHPDE